MISRRDTLLIQLDGHQARALEIIARGDVLLAPDAIPDPALLSQSRWQLTRILTGYQAFLHHAVFDPIIGSGAPDKARLARQMKAESIALGEDYRAHVARCTNLDIAAHWTSYRPAVARLLARVKAHMARERWVVESMLLAPARPVSAIAGRR